MRSSDARAWMTIRDALERESPGSFAWLANRIADSRVWPEIKRRIQEGLALDLDTSACRTFATACILQVVQNRLEQNVEEFVSHVGRLREKLGGEEPSPQLREHAFRRLGELVVEIVEPILDVFTSATREAAEEGEDRETLSRRIYRAASGTSLPSRSVRPNVAREMERFWKLGTRTAESAGEVLRYVREHARADSSASEHLVTGLLILSEVRNRTAHRSRKDGDPRRDQSLYIQEFFDATGLSAASLVSWVFGMAAYVCVRAFELGREVDLGGVHRPALDAAPISVQPAASLPVPTDQPPEPARETPRTRGGLALLAGAAFVAVAAAAAFLPDWGATDGPRRITAPLPRPPALARTGPATPPEPAKPTPPPPEPARPDVVAEATPPSLLEALGPAYRDKCADVRRSHQKKLAAGEYTPRPLELDTGRLEILPIPDDRVLRQEDLVERVRSREWKYLLVLAEGGLGKSELAEAVEAALCEQTPTFRIDLKDMDGPFSAEALDERVQASLADRCGVRKSDASYPEWRTKIAGGLVRDEWVLVLDGLDEMPLARRGELVRALNRLMGNGGLWSGTASVVAFGRPPLFDAARYGLEARPVLRIPPLRCEEVQQFVRARYKGKTEPIDQFWAFVEGRLDAREASPTCRYVHMSTFRHLGILLRLAEDSAIDPDLSRAGQAGIVQRYVLGILDKGLKRTRSESAPKTALVILDQLTNPTLPAAPFNTADCTAAAEGVLRSEARASRIFGLPTFEEVCTGILEGLLATPVDRERLRFRQQSVSDFFLAHRLDREARLVPKAGRCAALAERTGKLASGEVLGLLVGMDTGLQCFPELLRQACLLGPADDTKTRLFERGLPRDPRRNEWLAAARATLSEDPSAPPDPSDDCMRQVLDALVLPAGPAQSSLAR